MRTLKAARAYAAAIEEARARRVAAYALAAAAYVEATEEARRAHAAAIEKARRDVAEELRIYEETSP